MRSSLCRGFVVHQRRDAPVHGFRYGVFMLLLDLDELPALDARLRLFGCERPRVVSFRRRDHLGDPARSMRASIEDLLGRAGVPTPGGRIELLTHCRVAGYVFNPVSFFYCYDAAGALAAVVAEVNNTFGERHPYVLPVRDGTVWHEKKLMHVSPFFSMAGSYRFHLAPPGDDVVEARIDLWHGDHVALASRLSLRREPLSDGALARALVAFPFVTTKVIAAIHWQALRLWLKRAPVFTKPPYDPEAAKGESA